MNLLTPIGLLLTLAMATLRPAPLVTVRVHSPLTGYGSHEAFAQAAAQRLERVLNATAFHDSLMQGNYLRTNNLTRQQVYDAIMRAHEEAGPSGTDGVVDLRLRTVACPPDQRKWLRRCEPGSWYGTIGLDGGGDGVSAVCPQWLATWAGSNDQGALAGHYMHEYLHILGFDHMVSKQERPHTLVYQVGELVEKLIKAGV